MADDVFYMKKALEEANERRAEEIAMAHEDQQEAAATTSE